MEAGIRTPSEELVKACEDLPQLACNGALAKLHELLAKSLKNHRGAYPGWFAAWPDKEAAAKRLRSFSLVVIDGLLQTDDYARAILSTKVGITPEKLDAFIVADFEDAPVAAYQDTALAGQIIEDTDEAEALAHTWDTLRSEALPQAASLKLIEELAA